MLLLFSLLDQSNAINTILFDVLNVFQPDDIRLDLVISLTPQASSMMTKMLAFVSYCIHVYLINIEQCHAKLFFKIPIRSTAVFCKHLNVSYQ